MNRKQLILLLFVLIIIGGVALLHYRRQHSSWSATSPGAGQKLLGNLQVNDVARIRLQQGHDRVDLSHFTNIWTVSQRSGYPADFSKISQLLLKLQDLKVIQTEQVGPSQRPRLDLAPPGSGDNAATLLELDGTNGLPLRTLWLGKTHTHASPSAPGGQGWADGRYILTNTNSASVAVISDPLSEVVVQPDQWLDKTFFKVKNPQSIAVNFPASANSWKLLRASKTNNWQLADATAKEKLDTSKISGLTDAFSSPNFSDVLPPQDGDFSHPTQIEIRTFGGAAGHLDYAIKIGGKTNDDYCLKVKPTATFASAPKPGKKETAKQKAAQEKTFADEQTKLREKFKRENAYSNWTYLVPSWNISSILKPRHALLVVETNTTSSAVSTNSADK